MQWIPLNSIEQLDQIDKESDNNLVAIFKHSTSCGISSMVLRRFESDVKGLNIDEVKPYFLDLLKHRPISNAVSERYHVVHESPQLILIKNGKAIANSSHSAIQASSLTSV